MKEAFRTIFETAETATEAAVRLEEWIKRVEALGLRQLDSFITTLHNWWEKILNYFHFHITSGMVEGINNKIKLIKLPFQCASIPPHVPAANSRPQIGQRRWPVTSTPRSQCRRPALVRSGAAPCPVAVGQFQLRFDALQLILGCYASSAFFQRMATRSAHTACTIVKNAGGAPSL